MLQTTEGFCTAETAVTAGTRPHDIHSSTSIAKAVDNLSSSVMQRAAAAADAAVAAVKTAVTAAKTPTTVDSPTFAGSSEDTTERVMPLFVASTVLNAAAIAHSSHKSSGRSRSPLKVGVTGAVLLAKSRLSPARSKRASPPQELQHQNKHVQKRKNQHKHQHHQHQQMVQQLRRDRATVDFLWQFCRRWQWALSLAARDFCTALQV